MGSSDWKAQIDVCKQAPSLLAGHASGLCVGVMVHVTTCVRIETAMLGSYCMLVLRMKMRTCTCVDLALLAAMYDTFVYKYIDLAVLAAMWGKHDTFVYKCAGEHVDISCTLASLSRMQNNSIQTHIYICVYIYIQVLTCTIGCCHAAKSKVNVFMCLHMRANIHGHVRFVMYVWTKAGL